MKNTETSKQIDTSIASFKDNIEKKSENQYDKALVDAQKLVSAFFKSFPQNNLADHSYPLQPDKMIIKTSTEKYEIVSFSSDDWSYVEIRFIDSRGSKYVIRADSEAWAKSTISIKENDKIIDAYVKWSGKSYHNWIEKIAFIHIANLQRHLKLQLKK